MYPLVFFVTCFNLLYVLLLDTFLKCLILHRKNAPHWRVCTNLKMKKQIKVIFKNVKTSEWVMSPSEPGEGSSCRSCALSVSQRLRGGSHLGRVQHKTTNKNAQTQHRFLFFLFFVFFYSAWGEGVTGFMKGDWSHGCTAADSGGKDVSAVMWRSLLLTMTVIPLSGLDGL